MGRPTGLRGPGSLPQGAGEVSRILIPGREQQASKRGPDMQHARRFATGRLNMGARQKGPTPEHRGLEGNPSNVPLDMSRCCVKRHAKQFTPGQVRGAPAVRDASRSHGLLKVPSGHR